MEVERVRRRLSGLVVEAVELTAGRCPAAAVITCPFAVVIVPQSERPVDVAWVSVRPRPGCE